jgi:tetratricopeptide (TPR) repeat protein
MAPEIQMSYYLGANSYSETSDCTEKVDMWALGVMTYYMLFHDYPFSPSKPVPLSQYARDTALSFPESALQPISQDCYTFIKATMDPDATKRMSAKEAVQSKWLKSLETPVAEINRDGLTGTKLTSAASGEEVQTAQELSQAIPTETVEVLPNNSDRSSNGNMRADQSPRNSDPLTEDHTSAVQADTLKTNQLGAGTPDFANPKGGITEVAEDLPLHSLQRFHTEGVRLYHQKEYNEAEIMLQKAANGRSQKLGLTDHDTRNSFHCLGVLYYHMRKYSKSRSLFRRVLEIQEKEFGQIHQSTLKTEYWIGITMLRSGIYTKGRLVLKRVANIQKHVLGPNHPDTLLSLSELDQKHHSEVSKSSNIYSSPNVYPEVPSLEMIELTKVMRKAVQALKADLWPEHHSISFRRDYKRVTVKLPPNSSQPIAESQPLESVSSKVKTHYRTMAELGQWLHGKGHYQAAQSSLEMAVSGLNQYFESTDIKLMDALYWLGWNQFKLNQYEKAELTFREARNRWKRHHGFSRRHFDHAIGLALFKQGKYAMAEDTLDLSGLCDTTLFELGLILCNQGKFDEAKKSFKDAFFKQAHHGADYSGYWIQRIRHYWSDYEVPKACNVKLPGQTRTKIKLTRRTDLWPRSG